MIRYLKTLQSGGMHCSVDVVVNNIAESSLYMNSRNNLVKFKLQVDKAMERVCETQLSFNRFCF